MVNINQFTAPIFKTQKEFNLFFNELDSFNCSVHRINLIQEGAIYRPKLEDKPRGFFAWIFRWYKSVTRRKITIAEYVADLLLKNKQFIPSHYNTIVKLEHVWACSKNLEATKLLHTLTKSCVEAEKEARAMVQKARKSASRIIAAAKQRADFCALPPRSRFVDPKVAKQCETEPSDLKIICENDHAVESHQALLCAIPLFEAQSKTKEKEIHLNYPAPVVEDLLTYVKTGIRPLTADFTAERASKLFVAALKLQLSDLQTQCLKTMIAESPSMPILEGFSLTERSIIHKSRNEKADVEIKCRSGSVYAHSRVLKTMDALTARIEWAEKQHGMIVLTLTDYSEQAVLDLMDSLYFGTLPEFTIQRACELYALTNFLSLEQIKFTCEDFIKATIKHHRNNCAEAIISCFELSPEVRVPEFETFLLEEYITITWPPYLNEILREKLCQVLERDLKRGNQSKPLKTIIAYHDYTEDTRHSLLEEVVKDSYAPAQYILARCFSNKDEGRSRSLFELAHKQRYYPATNQLGALAHKREDYDLSVSLTQEAAAQDYVPAIYQLGALLTMGNGIPKNVTRGVKLVTRAAECGFSVAQFNLARIYFMDLCVGKKDLVKARYWCQRAANAGHKEAIELLAKMQS